MHSGGIAMSRLLCSVLIVLTAGLAASGCATTRTEGGITEIGASEHRHTPWRYRWRGTRTTRTKHVEHRPVTELDHPLALGEGDGDE